MVSKGCAHLDLALVERALTEHYGDIAAAARDLKVSTPDLRHLTWSKPRLLEGANEQCELFVIRAIGIMIQALNSGDPRREMWGAEKILASHLARDHPLAPARAASVPQPQPQVTFRWADSPTPPQSPVR